MRVLLWILLVSVTAVGQSNPWWDLSGAWRYIEGDDARYADPAFDDRAWSTVMLPGRNFLEDAGSDYFWLRKTILIPSDAAKDGRFTLVLGKLTENYEVFLNGRKVGRVGEFNVQDSQLARPLTFDLPPLPSSQLTIAVRAWIHSGRGVSQFWRRNPDPGPYRIVPTDFSPRNIGAEFIYMLRLTKTLDMVTGVALVSLSLIPLLIYFAGRQRVELLWLALYSALYGVRRLLVVLFIYPEAKPWNFGIYIAPLPMACLLEFVMAALGMRQPILRAVIWGTTAVACFSVPGFRIWQFLTAGIVLFLAWRPYPRRTEKLLITGATAVMFLLSARTDLPPSWIQGLPALNFRIGPSEIVAAAPRALCSNCWCRGGSRQIAGFTVDASYLPAQEVGGDFYYVGPAANGGVLVVVGDVSGKGLRAAMVVSMLSGAIANRRAQAPAELLTELNQVLCGRFDQGFVTAVCLLLTPGGPALASSAGHLAPYCDGEEVVVESGLPLGISPDASYAEVALDGRRFVLLSDGVVEAANSSRELFGFDRTRAISVKSAGEIAETSREWGQNDDITVVIVSRTPA